MLVNIFVKDNCTGYVHQVGTDPHDSLECWNGVVEYVNLQCMEGTMGGGYSFVEPPDIDDYVSVTPEQLMVNREMLHADIAAMIAANPELMTHTDKYDAIFEDDLHMIAAQNAIDEMPTIGAQPVKRGKWRKRMSTPDSVKCCLCGYASVQESSYCGGCGAFMRGDNDVG